MTPAKKAKAIKWLTNILFMLSLSLFGTICSAATIERTYTIPTNNNQVPSGGSKLFWVQVSGVDNRAIITNVEAKFDYIAYGVVHNYVSSRFNRGSDPGSSGGQVLVRQGSLPEGNPGTYGYRSFSTAWDGQGVNSNYYFRFFLASSSPYTCTILKLYVRITHAIPWLEVTNPKGGDTLTKGQNYTINWTSGNVSGNVLIHLYKASQKHTTISASTSNDGSYYPFNPSTSLPDGSNYQICMSAMGGTVSDCTDTFTIQSPPKPDLIVQSQNANPTTVEAGSTIDISCTVKNQGSGSANSSYVKYYLSSNTSYESSDTYLGSDYVSSLSTNASSSESATVTIPSGTSTGTKYVLFYADKDNSVTESNEINNVAYKQINVIGPAPVISLTAETWTGSRTGVSQSTFPYNGDVALWLRIQNSGRHVNTYMTLTEPVNGTRYCYYSDNALPDGSEDPPKALSFSSSKKAMFTSPWTVVAGDYLINRYIYSAANTPGPRTFTYWYEDADTGATISTDTASFTVEDQPADTPFFSPLFRGYSSTDTDHFYTTNPAERDSMTANGYTYEKIDGYISNRPFTDGVTLHRLYNSSARSHYYTTSDTERDTVLEDPNWGYEGAAGYVYPIPHENLVPMYHLYSASDDDHFYTISEFERDYATDTYGYQDMGVAFYVARNSSNSPLAGKPVARKGGVDLSSGNFVPYRNHVDFANPPGFGLPFVFARTYNSKNTGASGPLGPGWNHSYQIRVYAAGDIALVKWGNGRDDYYTLDGSNYEPAPGVYNKLEKTLGSYILTTKDKTAYTFEEYANANGVSSGRLVEIKDRNGVEMTLMYDPARLGVLDHVIDGSNRTYRFHYIEIQAGLSDSNRYKLERITEENAGSLSRSISFGYDETGRLISYTDAEGNKTTYAYENLDNPGLLTKIILPRGNEINASYDGDRVDVINIGGSKTVNLTYDQVIDEGSGQVYGTVYSVQVANGPNQTISASHDQSKLGIIKDGLDNKAEVLAYDGNFNPTRIKDKNGKEWRFSYDPNTGNMLSSTNPLSQVTWYEYDPAEPNHLIEITDPANNVTRFEYDGKGNVEKIIRVVDGIDRITTIARYANGQVETITIPPNNSANVPATTAYTYDSYGYLNTVTDHLGNTATFTFDPGGRLLTQKDADLVTVDYTYDLLNHVKTAKDMLNRLTRYNYDGNGNLDNVTDPRTIVTDYNYTDRDLVETVTKAAIRVAKYDYDEAGRLTKVTNARDRSWEMSFDEAGNLKSTQTPLGLTDHFQEYYPDGRLKRQVDRNNRETSYIYDDAGRLIRKNITSGHQYGYEYWPNGLMKKVLVYGTQVGYFEYDARGNLKAYTDPYGKVVTYSYYPGGKLKQIVYPGSKVVTYDYDARNLLTSVKDWLDRSTTYEYSDAGRLKKIIYPNGAYIEYLYDPYYRLKTVTNRKADGTVICEYTADSFDEMDAPLEVTITGGITALGTSFTADYNYDPNNRIVSAGAASFTHNNMGEMLTKTRNGITTTFAWDSSDVPGRLRSITASGVSSSYEYDGLGNRTAATVDGVTTRYVLDVSGRMANVLAETDTSGNVKAYYIHGLGLAARVLPNGTAHYYHYDRNGNTVALTDDSGNVTDQYAYDLDPYGFQIARQGATPNPFTFVGRYGVMDEGNDIFYMRARFYDAEVGRFLNEDPIGFAGGDLNLYAYVGGNPAIRVDPSGYKFDLFQKIDEAFDKLYRGLTIATKVAAEAFVSTQSQIVPLVEGGHLESLKAGIAGFQAAVKTAGDALTTLNVLLNSLYEIKEPDQSWKTWWEGLSNGDLGLLTADDWLDAIGHGTASMTAVAWNSTTGWANAVVTLSSGDEFEISLTGEQVYDFATTIVGP